MQWVGKPHPLGATYDGSGTNFALFSSIAEGVELCLFGDSTREGRHDEVRIDVTEVDGHIWHVYLPEVRPGQHYGWRVHGPWDPAPGPVVQPEQAADRPLRQGDRRRRRLDAGVLRVRRRRSRQAATSTTAPRMCRWRWSATRSSTGAATAPPRTAMHETIIYEAHVRGLTMRHPGVPEHLRGTYSGVAHPAVIDHLVRLGVTAIELMPVHQFIHDHHLQQLGLRNYWGYNTIGFFAPHNEYAARSVLGQAQEFKAMVKTLHRAGIEVILDVVYNHTAEGNHLGPTLSMRGIDNPAYYRLLDGNPREYLDFTGTGNSMNVRHPHVLQLIMDSLRYWHLDMHVDGFRFDLASALARELYEVDRLSAFFDIVQQDPAISQVKLIAEPWDVGDGGYQVGNFPPRWSEWNGRYRDTIRDLWRGEPATLSEFGIALHRQLRSLRGGDPQADGVGQLRHLPRRVHARRPRVVQREAQRAPTARPTTTASRSTARGTTASRVATDDPAIIALRDRQRRNMVATLLLSQGVPMLLGGDELGRTQLGNNNAYCQDNEMSWYDWVGADTEFLEWVRRLVAYRAAPLRVPAPALVPGPAHSAAWTTWCGSATTARR